MKKVCDEWPDGNLRPRKWFDLQECLDELVSNGRYAQFKAVLKCSVVGDKNNIYRKQFKRDQLALKAKQEFWPRLYNKKYKKVSEEFSGAEVYVSIIVYNELGKVLLSTGECGIGLDKVKIEHEPYVWRSSKIFNSIGEKLSYGKFLFISEYDPKKGVSSDVFDMGKYKKCIHFYSTLVCSSKLTEGNWISFEQWKQKYQSDAKIFELIRSAIKDGRVKRWSGPTNDKADKMQLEIDRLKGELAKTKNDLVAAKISLSKKKR